MNLEPLAPVSGVVARTLPPEQLLDTNPDDFDTPHSISYVHPTTSPDDFEIRKESGKRNADYKKRQKEKKKLKKSQALSSTAPLGSSGEAVPVVSEQEASSSIALPGISGGEMQEESHPANSEQLLFLNYFGFLAEALRNRKYLLSGTAEGLPAQAPEEEDSSMPASLPSPIFYLPGSSDGLNGETNEVPATSGVARVTKLLAMLWQTSQKAGQKFDFAGAARDSTIVCPHWGTENMPLELLCAQCS